MQTNAASARDTVQAYSNDALKRMKTFDVDALRTAGKADETVEEKAKEM